MSRLLTFTSTWNRSTSAGYPEGEPPSKSYLASVNMVSKHSKDDTEIRLNPILIASIRQARQSARVEATYALKCLHTATVVSADLPLVEGIPA